MKKIAGAIAIGGLVLTVLAAFDGGAFAVDGGDNRCTAKRLAGRWLFATDVGQFPAFGGDITALGTMNIDGHGNLEGKFDFTVAQVIFLPDNTYVGSVVVNPDCTGTLTFVTSEDTMRTDSIAVVSSDEIWGMSQDTANLWTYRARRISPPSHR